MSQNRIFAITTSSLRDTERIDNTFIFRSGAPRGSFSSISETIGVLRRRSPEDRRGGSSQLLLRIFEGTREIATIFCNETAANNHPLLEEVLRENEIRCVLLMPADLYPRLMRACAACKVQLDVHHSSLELSTSYDRRDTP